MIILGIDPGQKGCIAIFDTERKMVDFYDMPLMPDKGIDSMEIRSQLAWVYTKSKGEAFCILEKAQPMPNQGSVGGFNYGVGYGKILACLEMLGIPFEEVRPDKWKKEFGLSGTKGKRSKPGEKKAKKTPEQKLNEYKQRKLMAAKIASHLFPEEKQYFYTKKGALLDGRCEALLMAEYGRRKVKQS